MMKLIAATLSIAWFVNLMNFVQDHETKLQLELIRLDDDRTYSDPVFVSLDNKTSTYEFSDWPVIKVWHEVEGQIVFQEGISVVEIGYGMSTGPKLDTRLWAHELAIHTDDFSGRQDDGRWCDAELDDADDSWDRLDAGEYA